jgi:hypothetical protein
VATAVRMNPAIVAIAKPTSISWPCHNIVLAGSVVGPCPCSTITQTMTMTTANTALNKKKGRNA